MEDAHLVCLKNDAYSVDVGGFYLLLFGRYGMVDQKNTIWFTVACAQHETSELSISDQERVLRGLSFSFRVDHAEAYWNLVWLASQQKWSHLYV